MSYALLGPLEIRADENVLPVQAGKQRAVLAMLLLNPNRVVSLNELAECLWGSRPPTSARISIQNYVKRLRQALAGAGRPLIGTRPGGYLITADDAEIDIWRFEALLDEARNAARATSWAAVAAAATAALMLWRGEPLADAGSELLSQREVPWLTEMRLQALELRIDADLRLGRHADVLAELRRLTRVHPWREQLHALLMLALYRDGQQAAALAAYRAARDVLVSEVGVEPGAGLTALHQQVLAADPALTAEPQPARAQPATLSTPPPSPAEPDDTSATGLDPPEATVAFGPSYRALAPGHQELLRRLAVSPGVTFTRPAVAALADCPRAEAEQALGALLDQHLLAPTTGRSFRFAGAIRGEAVKLATGDDGVAEQEQAVSRLADYYLHAAGQADRLLHPFRGRAAEPPGEGGPRELVTPEDAAGWLKREWRNVLAVARYAGQHGWEAKAADLIDQLAYFMENSALWDEAAAAHTLALQASRDLADPGRTARAALALSAVRQLTGQPETAIPLAEEAAAIYRSQGDRAGEARALDLVGQAHFRMARWREAVACCAEARVLYHAAGDPRGVADTLCHIGICGWQLGRHSEATAQMRQALTLYRAAGDRLGEAKAHHNLGRIHFFNGHHRDALDAYEEALSPIRELGAAQLEAIFYQNMGSVHRAQGSLDEALAAYQKALAMYRDIGDRLDEAEALNDIGTIYESAGRHDDALAHHQRAQAIAEEVGNLSQQLVALRLMADIHRGAGRYEEARNDYQAALRMARENGDPYEEGKILEGMAEASLSTGRFGAARMELRQALDIYERLDVPEVRSVRARLETIAC